VALVRTARIVESKKFTETVRWIKFKMIEPAVLYYQPGNYIILQGRVEGGIKKHAYCFFSIPKEDGSTFELCVKIVSDGNVSRYIDELKIGEAIAFGGPYGSFYPPAEDLFPLIYVTTGTGMSSVHAHLAFLLTKNYHREIKLFWGLRSEEDLFLLEVLESWAQAYKNFSYHIALSQPQGKWEGARGRVTDLLPKVLKNFKPYKFYLSGNGAMIQDVLQLLEGQGVPLENISKEVYFMPRFVPPRVL